jgi:hypothetical protein
VASGASATVERKNLIRCLRFSMAEMKMWLRVPKSPLKRKILSMPQVLEGGDENVVSSASATVEKKNLSDA